MASLSRRSPKSKPSRRSFRVTAPFGAGILRYSVVYDVREHTPSDEDWAARSFADESAPTDAELDAMATERAWEADYAAGLTEMPRCDACGLTYAGTSAGGLCGLCRDAIERGDEYDGSDETVAGVNRHFGLGNRAW